MTDQNDAALDLCTSSGGRAYIAEYFATQLRRHDFARYINNTLAADFACALAQHLSKLRAEGVQAGDEESPPIIPDDEEIAGACINASDIDGIAYDGPSFERGYRAAMASAPVADIRDELNRLGMFAHTALNLDAGDMRNNMDDLADRLLALAGGAPVTNAPVAGNAQPSRERFKPPFANCSFRMCDLPGQCRGEGKCHHPAPQASEAVRDAALEEAAAIFDGLPVPVVGSAAMLAVPGRIRALKSQPYVDEDGRGGILRSAEELGYVRRIKEAALFNHSRVPGGFVQVRQYDLRKTMQIFAKMECASLPAPLGSSWEASWAEFNTWHQRHFGAFVPVAPLDNARLIGWQAGTANERSRLRNQAPPTPQPQNRTEALHG